MPVPDDGAGKAYWQPANFINIGEPRPTSNTFTAPADKPNAAHVALIRQDSARIVRRENARVEAIAKQTASDPAKWATDLSAFYVEHATAIADALIIPVDVVASDYCVPQRVAVVRAGIGALESRAAQSVDRLVEIALKAHEVTT